MKRLRVKNWEQFQHYKHRSPPWIKLHREILNDYAFQSLPDATKAHLVLIWVLAAGTEGVIPHDARFIASRIGATTRIDLAALVQAEFLLVEGDDSLNSANVATAAAQLGSPENIANKTRQENVQAAKRVLASLNELTTHSFGANDANLSIIIARLKEYTEEQLIRVIVDRVGAWSADDKMREYLRPATLFNKTKCAQYVGGLPQ